MLFLHYRRYTYDIKMTLPIIIPWSSVRSIAWPLRTRDTTKREKCKYRSMFLVKFEFSISVLQQSKIALVLCSAAAVIFLLGNISSRVDVAEKLHLYNRDLLSFNHCLVIHYFWVLLLSLIFPWEYRDYMSLSNLIRLLPNPYLFTTHSIFQSQVPLCNIWCWKRIEK
jgi:hypothetical protein